MNVWLLFSLIKYISFSSRLAQSAQWYHSIPVLSQTHLSETRSSPDSESAKPRKSKNSSNPKTPCLFSWTSFPVMSKCCLFIAGRDTAVHSWYSTWSDLVCGQSQRPAAVETAAAAAAAVVVNLAVNLASKRTRM